MLTFQIRRPANGAEPDTIDLVGDEDGLKSLRAQLDFILAGRTDHVDLMSAAWGGTQLDVDAIGGAIQVHCVKIRQASEK